MFYDKQSIIESEGVDVNIYGITSLLTSSKALIGRSNRTGNVMLPLEAYRKGMFLPQSNIKNGNIVKNLVTNETYIVVSSFNEIIDNRLCAINTMMIKCNVAIDIIGDGEETADDVGNIYKTKITKASDLSAYLEIDNLSLTQYKAGLYPNNRYSLYIPSLDISLLDQIIVKSLHDNLVLKIVSIDNLSYEDLVVLTVTSDVDGGGVQ
jgi:hypothetical protein